MNSSLSLHGLGWGRSSGLGLSCGLAAHQSSSVVHLDAVSQDLGGASLPGPDASSCADGAVSQQQVALPAAVQVVQSESPLPAGTRPHASGGGYPGTGGISKWWALVTGTLAPKPSTHTATAGSAGGDLAAESQWPPSGDTVQLPKPPSSTERASPPQPPSVVPTRGQLASPPMSPVPAGSPKMERAASTRPVSLVPLKPGAAAVPRPLVQGVATGGHWRSAMGTAVARAGGGMPLSSLPFRSEFSASQPFPGRHKVGA